MGTPEFAVNTLREIVKAGHEVIGVVTQPDKAKGRGGKISYPEVKEAAIELNLPVYQPQKIKEPEFIQFLKDLQPDVIVVAAYGKILPKDILDIPPYGCINVHASLLPKYRGAAPIQAAIIDGENETGVTIMHMDVGLDTGDMILQERIPISKDETGGSLHDKLAELGAKLLVKALEQIKDGTASRVPQDDSKATYVKMLDKEMGSIDFTKPAEYIERLIRGLDPWPSAYTKLDGKTLKLWKARVKDTNIIASPGEVIEVNKDSIVVMTGKDALEILELQLEGKKRLSAAEFLRGYRIDKGTVLGN